MLTIRGALAPHVHQCRSYSFSSTQTSGFPSAQFIRVPWNQDQGKKVAAKISNRNVQENTNAQKSWKTKAQSMILAQDSSSIVRNTNSTVITPSYIRFSDCIIFPAAKKPRAIVHFIGGAFIGAVPEVTYSLFIELLTQRDYLVIATPYNVTFEHLVAAEKVDQLFWYCRESLLNGEITVPNMSPEEVLQLPVFSVGHSNGALLQLLIGCNEQERLPKIDQCKIQGNAVIAFNNKPAADAVPYFEQLGPITAQFAPAITAIPLFDLSKNLPGVSIDGLLEAVSPVLGQYDKESLQSLQNFVEQIPLVLDQVSKGTSEFTPAPLENRETIEKNYSVKNTLLVQYKVDAIDETEIVENILKSRVETINGNLQKIAINGNHITPCVQDIKWEVGKFYTPADAVGQAFRSIALAEIRDTVATISDWFEKLM